MDKYRAFQANKYKPVKSTNQCIAIPKSLRYVSVISDFFSNFIANNTNDILD